MKPSPVRELARRYAAGELSQDEYRTERRHLIDAICAGTQSLEYGQATARRIQPHKSARLLLIPAAAVLALAVGVSLWIIASRYPHTGSAPTRSVTLSGPQLLQSFTDSNDWNDASINQFLQQWKQLPAKEQRAARDSYIFPRMLSQLHEQIVSQQAMLELAPDPQAAARHLTHLQQMAAQVSANNSR